jgi:hypothetical protein
VVGKGAHAGNSCALLSATGGAGADEHAGVFAPERALRPLLAGGIPKSLELRWHVSVPSGDTEEDTVVLLKLSGVVDGGDAGILGGSVHLGQDFLGERLGDPGTS